LMCQSRAFTIPSSKGRVSTNLFDSTKEPPFIAMPKDISYGEESRKYRRTVYTHDDWVKHRSPDRFVRNAISIITSGIYKNIAKEVLFVTAIATVLVVGNSITGSYQDFSGVTHDGLLKDTIIPSLSLPMTPFSLSSASLGLLLVFRTNTGYQRWDEARKNWGMNINHTRDLVRMGASWYDSRGVSKEQRDEDLNVLALATWSFVRSMKRHLSPAEEDEEDFKKELYEKLPKEQAEAIINAAHRPNRALFDLTVAIENLPMHWMRKNEINKAVTIFEDNLGSSERLLTSPVPLFYSRHTARFLFFWLSALPLALYDSFGSSWNHAALIPAIAVLSLFMFGIEELANQLEEPFTILPMQAFCDKIYNWCMEIVSWEAGDNGMPEPQQQPKTVSISPVKESSPVTSVDKEFEDIVKIASDVLEEVVNISIETAQDVVEEMNATDEVVEELEDPAKVMKEQFSSDIVESSPNSTEDPVVTMKAFSNEAKETAPVSEEAKAVDTVKEVVDQAEETDEVKSIVENEELVAEEADEVEAIDTGKEVVDEVEETLEVEAIEETEEPVLAVVEESKKETNEPYYFKSMFNQWS